MTNLHNKSIEPYCLQWLPSYTHQSPIKVQIDYCGLRDAKRYLKPSCNACPRCSVRASFSMKAFTSLAISLLLLLTKCLPDLFITWHSLVTPSALWRANFRILPFCALFIEIALFFRFGFGFGFDLRPVRQFWHLLCGKVSFYQNLLRTVPNVRFLHFL